MIKFDLAALSRRNSRAPLVLRPITTTQAQIATLAALYMRVVRVWADARELIVSTYAQTLSELQTDSAGDLQSAMNAMNAEAQRVVVLLTPDMRGFAMGYEKVHRGKWVRNVLSAVQVQLETMLSEDDVDDTIEAFLEWNTSLVRDVSDETRRRIANTVFSGVQQRRPVAEVAKEISESVGMARARARRIAADQSTKLGARLNQARQEQAGLSHYKWRHSGKKHPREWHKERDGAVYPWRGEGSIAPDDQPSVPPFCGCTAQGVIVPE